MIPRITNPILTPFIMKKELITIIAALCSLSMSADDVTPGITVSKTDGSSASIPLTTLQSIKFSDGNMAINMKDKSQQTFTIDEIAIIKFEDIATAINTLSCGNTSNSNISISDLSGHTVYKGKAADAIQTKLPAGIYVITTNGKSYKVMIK